MVTVKYSNGVSVDHNYQFELKCFDHGKYMKSLFFYKYSGAKAWANGFIGWHMQKSASLIHFRQMRSAMVAHGVSFSVSQSAQDTFCAFSRILKSGN